MSRWHYDGSLLQSLAELLDVDGRVLNVAASAALVERLGLSLGSVLVECGVAIGRWTIHGDKIGADVRRDALRGLFRLGE